MRLRLLEIARFAQFMDEQLKVDPRVTVLVGKNDTGKTVMLDSLINQAFYVGAHGGHAIPYGKDCGLAYALTWVVEDDDIERLPTELLGKLSPGDTIKFSCEDGAKSDSLFTYQVNEELVLDSNCDSWVEPRDVFPPVYYVDLTSRHLPAREFEARLQAGKTPIASSLNFSTAESLLLSLGGMQAETSTSFTPGSLWEKDPPPAWLFNPLEEQDVRQRLRGIEERISTQLGRFWVDPEPVKFEFRLGPCTRNAWSISWSLSEPNGSPLYGMGLHWFLALIVVLENLRDASTASVLLIDEPGSALHPSAQKQVVRLLEEFAAARNQVILTTHSPFTINWNFPQRLRLLQRNYPEKRTHINNKPYFARRPLLPWDPLREGIGVSLGDLAVLGEVNLLVEGITDQLLLANASAVLEEQGRTYLPLSRYSILPYTDSRVLTQVISVGKARGAKLIVLGDTDEQGRSTSKLCKRENVPFVSISDFAEAKKQDAAIEDIVGVDAYLAAANEFYSRFDWFETLDVEDVRANCGDKSLGRYLAERFKDQSFSKFEVTVKLVGDLNRLPGAVIDRFENLVRRILEEGS